ncbi:MAG: N-acetylmuramoyl-L-alanine amidase [Thermotogae bacterium]|nr:N-acetylmuramoyl-L-alanine amidase [Thermotogota bacterium]
MFLILSTHWLSTGEIKRITGALVYTNRVIYRGKVARYRYEDAVVFKGQIFPLRKVWRGRKLYVRADQLAPLLLQMGGNWFWDSENRRFFKGKPTIRLLMGRSKGGYTITVTAQNGKFSLTKAEDSLVVKVRGLYGKFWKVVGDGNYVSFIRVIQKRRNTEFVIHLGPQAGTYSTSIRGDTLHIFINKLKPRKAKETVIVIDPGHGGRDAGAIGNGYKEKNINLAVALKVAQILKRKGYKVILTRSKDRYVSLYARARIANRSGAHLFVSIHCNASKDKNARGMETYFLSESRTSAERAVAILENSALKYDLGFSGAINEPVENILGDLLQNLLLEQSYELALSIHRTALNMALTEDRGVKQAGFYVLKWVMMPSVLVELGFITNRKEVKRLSSEIYQRKLAKAIAKGIEVYIEKQKRR